MNEDSQPAPFLAGLEQHETPPSYLGCASGDPARRAEVIGAFDTLIAWAAQTNGLAPGLTAAQTYLHEAVLVLFAFGYRPAGLARLIVGADATYETLLSFEAAFVRALCFAMETEIERLLRHAAAPSPSFPTH